MKHRSAYTLIEMLIVVAVASVLASLTVICLQGAYRIGRDGAVQAEHACTLNRLSVQFRQDVHAARSAALANEDESPGTLVLVSTDDQRIEYRLGVNQLRRVVRRRETRVHQDVFLLAQGTTARFEIEAQRFVHVWVERQTESQPPDHLMAVVGGVR